MAVGGLCSTNFISNQLLAGNAIYIIALVSIGVAFSLAYMLNNFNLSSRSKIGLIYLHIMALLLPLVVYGTQHGCMSLNLKCASSLRHFVPLAVTGTVIAGIGIGLIGIPSYFMFSNKQRRITSGWMIRFVKKHAAQLAIKPPKIYAVDKVQPLAFSFKSAIFVSLGLLDILSKKETEAVLLHELSHIKNKSSAFKFSLFLTRFSPFSILPNFHQENSKEELAADQFAAKVQRTPKYLNSAKNKINAFSRLSKK